MRNQTLLEANAHGQNVAETEEDHRTRQRTQGRVGARAMGSKNARRLTAHGRKAASTRGRAASGPTKAALYRRAKRAGIEGRSKMSKRQLQNALRG